MGTLIHLPKNKDPRLVFQFYKMDDLDWKLLRLRRTDAEHHLPECALIVPTIDLRIT